LPWVTIVTAFAAGIVASLACGLGALPLMVRGFDPVKQRGIGYGFAGGLMFAASVYNLLLPALDLGGGGWTLGKVLPIVGGVLLGAMFLQVAEFQIHDSPERPERWKRWGGRVGLLVFIAMTVHSIPEGVAVGVGYAADNKGVAEGMGPTLALAIAIHNIPEGLAVAIPLRGAGAGIGKCFWAAVATSLTQPLATVPAVLLAWFFTPLMPVLMGFAAGAMVFLVILELIPEALETESPRRIAWAFTLGFCLMLMVQVVL
jgi:zinc transporter, ZIP family